VPSRAGVAVPRRAVTKSILSRTARNSGGEFLI
jgi:hypothetical protein